MANKADRFYFENFIAATDCTCQAAAYLVDCLKDYDPARIQPMLERMHELEHAADQKKHEMSTALAKAFVTPLDREDLAELSQNIDEVMDCIEDVLQGFYINQIQTVRADAVAFAEKIHTCCLMMREMMVEFEHFKKPEPIHTMIVDLNHAEEDCDRFYLNATVKVRQECHDVLEILSWREVYDDMERCADACEHVADSVETVVMKNT